MSEGINEAVERAHRDGVLQQASLMVAGPAAADAVARARRLPGLRVGLHVVAVEGPACLPPERIPGLVDASGWFGSDQLRLGLAYAFDRAVRDQLRQEIAAQFDGFAGTGLTLAHADAHKHMHLHPFVAHLLLREGARHGLRRVRVPRESGPSLGARAMAAWCGLLARQVRRAGMTAPDQVVGIARSGHMTEAAVIEALGRLPPGETEIYLHPAAYRDALLVRLMPGYEHEAELAALLSPRVAAAAARAAGRG